MLVVDIVGIQIGGSDTTLLAVEVVEKKIGEQPEELGQEGRRSD